MGPGEVPADTGHKRGNFSGEASFSLSNAGRPPSGEPQAAFWVRAEEAWQALWQSTSWGVRKHSLQAQLNHYLNIHRTHARAANPFTSSPSQALEGSDDYSQMRKLRLR